MDISAALGQRGDCVARLDQENGFVGGELRFQRMHVDQAAPIHTIGEIMAGLGVFKRHGDIGGDARAHHATAGQVQAGRRVDGHYAAARVAVGVDAIDERGVKAVERPVQSDAEERIHPHVRSCDFIDLTGAQAGNIQRERFPRANERVAPKRARIAGGQQRDVRACSGRERRKRIAVTAVVSASAGHGDGLAGKRAEMRLKRLGQPTGGAAHEDERGRAAGKTALFQRVHSLGRDECAHDDSSCR